MEFVYLTRIRKRLGLQYSGKRAFFIACRPQSDKVLTTQWARSRFANTFVFCVSFKS